tara:strand:- start:827 stop:1174 length:348 start_codon:yes stop_codon:yes gene_type:complete
MANGNTEDWLVKLQDALTDLKIVTTNVESKLDQLKEGMEKIEVSMSELSGVTARQETRLSILEEKYESCSKLIPMGLGEDLAIMKSQVKTLNRVLWIVSTCIIGIIFEIFVTKIM